MGKKIKMVLYGEPGVGKSVFASKAPKPFFITTDGNYEWLEDFGAKAEAHKQCFTWQEIKDAIDKSYDEYETLVLDLAEDAFKWCEHDFCIKNKIDHVSDIGFGKAYDITRNDYFLTICKLLSKDKNIIIIMHGIEFISKDRRGVEHTKYGPTERIPAKVLDLIEGRVRYFLRCYLKGVENEEGQVVKKRFLSLIPKENEFGIVRGIDESTTPNDIELDWNEFVKALGVPELSTDTKYEKIETSKTEVVEQPKVEEVKEVEKVVEQSKATSNEDKIKAIKEKLANMKKEG